MVSIGILARTLGGYQPRQLVNYCLRRVVKPRPDLRDPPARRARKGPFVQGISRSYPEIRPGVFRLLNLEHSIALPSDWSTTELGKLWLYTLHYHEMLSADETYAGRQRMLVQRWIDENPPGKGVGWDPYPISLRSMQWIKWLTGGNSPVPNMLNSLAVQTRYLRHSLETHLGANHLFVNAVALVAAGLFFEGPEADVWLTDGLAILSREIGRQFLLDGAHFELSPSYHALLLESMLDLENLAIAYGCTGPRPWAAIIPHARYWLAAMTRPDGDFTQFNDCSQNAAPKPAEIENYARSIGLSNLEMKEVPVIALSDSGYFRYQRGGYSAVVDAGPFSPRIQPGHGHCDMLSFELSVGKVPIIVNLGTSTYERSPRRQLERSTAAHNTVQVAGLEQTEIWSAFRAGRRAKILECRANPECLVAMHDGFRSVQALHRRKFQFSIAGVGIRDEIIGTGSLRPAVARMHFAPGVTPTMVGKSVYAGPLQIKLHGATAVSLSPYEYAPEFNRRIPATVLEAVFAGCLETEITVT